ncbi:Aste57867_4889 [Aphanomyces stellatus]|uniref:Aste57867_4889 protein n=1 Tax=Aphanomyces stellatus TaxID=120398 RepID=A0A485KC07_9STRA|nr:hypothetical protein As57867_004876 [Aphanomyces stellatus]VFT81981.1 Aste57867_4889 [Aphanomyces stellatus]
MQDDSVQGQKELKDRLRRHHWIPKYEVEFGLQVVERHPHTGEVILAVCGLCKSFGREVREKEEEDISPSAGQRKRRRGLTTTKYFRSFRVDNIRSHLSGAHPVRWQEYQVLAKNEDLRRNYLAQSNVNMGLMTSLPMNMMGLPAGMDDSGDLDSETQLAMNAIVQQSTRQSTPSKRNSSLPSSMGGKRPPPLDPKTVELQKYQLDWERLEFERMRFQKELQMKEIEEKQAERKLRHEKEMREKDRELELEKAKIEQEKFNKLVDCLNRALGHSPVSAVTNAIV